MLQSIRMNRFNNLLLYQDKAASGLALRLIFVIIPALLVAFSLYLWYAGNGARSLELLVEGLVIGLILWIIVPNQYQVFEDRLRIVLRGPLAISIEFKQIKTIEITARTTLTVNLVSTLARSYVRIVRQRGLSLAITPKHCEIFVDNANRALSQWQNNLRSQT